MNKISAIVIGGELNGLGVVRSLAHQKIPTYVVDTKRSKAALWSRYARSYIVRSFSGSDFVEDIIRLGKKFDRPPILFLTNETAVHTVSENRDKLSPWFRFRLPHEMTVKLLSNKSSFYDFALEKGFPVPRTVVMHSLADLIKLADLYFPCALKLDDKRSTADDQNLRTLRVNSRQEAIDYARPFLQMSRGIVVQEWIDGAESNLYFTLFYRGSEGAFIHVFTGQKIVCSPHDVGNTAICKAAPEVHEELERLTLAFAESANYEGMGSMEYKWDDFHKKYVMVEPTVGRTDWQEEIATLCGTNIPLAAYSYEAGLPLSEFPKPNLTSAMWRSTFSQRLPSHLQKQCTYMVDGYFRWDDPLPAAQYYCFDQPISRILQRGQKYFKTWNESIFGGGNK